MRFIDNSCVERLTPLNRVCFATDNNATISITDGACKHLVISPACSWRLQSVSSTSIIVYAKKPFSNSYLSI
jgi:hypothetical protein